MLNSVSKVLIEYKKTDIAVIGHSDSIGDEYKNQTLSLNRARSVSSYLESHGVDFRRLRVTGVGSSNPIASNSHEDGRSQNRRVEIEIVPISQ